MIRLPASLSHCNGSDYAQTLKQELAALPTGSLPLHTALSHGGQVDDSNIAVTVFASEVDDDTITTEVGVFFSEVIGGCNCADDPHSENAYCRLQVRINRQTGEAGFAVIDEA